MHPCKNKVKVLHFLSQGNIGGKEKSLYLLFRAFKNHPWIEFSLATYDLNSYYVKKIKELGCNIIRHNIKTGFNLFIKLSVWRKFKEFDIHHHHDPSPNMVLFSLLSSRKIKLIETRRGGLEYFSEFPIKIKLKMLLKRILYTKFFDGFSAISNNSKLSLIKNYGVDANRIFITHNYFSPEHLKITKEKKIVMQEMGLNSSEFIVGSSCRLVSWKRIDLLIRAFNKLKLDNKKLVIIGTGPEEQKLKSLSDFLGIRKKILFIGEKKDVANYLQILNCYVFPSNYREGWGNAGAEALYLNIPTIIMEDNFAASEYVIDNKTGFVARNESHLSKLMLFIYNNFDFAKNIAVCGHNFIRNTYTEEKMIKEYENLYNSVLSNHYENTIDN